MRDDLPSALGRGSPGQIPAVLLADALHRVVVATQTVAARFVVVDPVDDAAHAYYQHHGFRAIPGTLRLIQKVSDVAAAIGLDTSGTG